MGIFSKEPRNYNTTEFVLTHDEVEKAIDSVKLGTFGRFYKAYDLAKAIVEANNLKIQLGLHLQDLNKD